MKRILTSKLNEWRDKKNRMPLLLHGARQVGKTYILKEFGRTNFENTVYINLETNAAVNAFFESDISPERIIQYLETIASERIIPGKTLLILDEIQSSERALLSLKTFCEDAPQYHVVAAGSLLGVAINREKFSFPVGKVDELQLFPLDFEEFLWASGNESLANQIREHFDQDEKMPLALHEQSMELFKRYFIVGGMPAAVLEWVESNSLLPVVDIQSRILNEYVADMAKYATPATSVKIRSCYQSIPAQLAKDNAKFQYKVVQRGGTATIFGEAIEWLTSAGVALKCQRLEHGTIPINAYADLSDFKLYMGDIGILTMRSGMPQQLILSPIEEDNTFLGAMTENYVAQVFASKGYPLYYWRSENTAEVDFVLQQGLDVVPVEVKKGKRVRSASMNIFKEKYKTILSIRISKKNFGQENGIKSVPLYAVFCI